MPEFLENHREMARRIREYDWHANPLGPAGGWPQSLQTTVKLMLASSHPMLIFWGANHIQIYNDAHAGALCAARHPAGLGQPGPDAWPESWNTLGLQVQKVCAGEGAAWHEHQLLPVCRGGQVEDAHWTYSLNGIEHAGQIGGVLMILQETTETVLALRDVTERLAARIAACSRTEISEYRLRSMFETSAQFFSVLGTDGALLDANAAALDAAGARLGDVLGKKIWETTWFSGTPDAADGVKADFAEALAGGAPRREILLNLPPGAQILEISMRPLRDAGGKIISVVVEGADLTARRAAEEQRRQAQKMEAIGQLTGGLAHDFNNLLTGISGSLDRLKIRIAQGRVSEAGRYIDAATTAASRAAALTHRLLAFSRRQTLDAQPVQINHLVQGMDESLRRQLGPGILLKLKCLPELWTVLCDAPQLENAVQNLCMNARDAMPDGGVLTIETENVTVEERQAQARGMTPGRYAAIFVSDTGSGMDAETASRAFDPFFTTKPIGLGTGLGLSMIFGFAQQSGGQVRIHSAPAQGTTVCLFLPRLGDDDVARAAEVPPEPEVTSGGTVLVVDDEPTVRMLVVEVLEELGLAVIEAGDGAAGLKILQSAQKIDLLISDVGLPGDLNGRQMADAARQKRPELKVMFITGYAEAAVVGAGTLEPGMVVITKPFSLEILAQRISALLAG